MKKIKVFMICSMLMLPASKSHAEFPLVDIPNLAAGVWGNIQKMAEGIQNSELYNQLFTLVKENFKLETASVNNGAANYVARTNAAKQEIQNMEMAEQMQPIGNACQQVTFAFSLGDLGCKAETAGKKFLDNPSRKAYLNNNDKEKQKIAKQLVEDIQSTYPGIFKKKDSDKDVATSEDAPIAYSLNANPLFSSSEAFLALDQEEYDAMSNLISLIVPDYSFRETYKNLDDLNERQLLLFSSSEALRSVPEQSLKAILGVRTSGEVLAREQGSESSNTSSKLHSLSEAIKDASSESAIYSISVGDTSTPSQLYRHRVLNLARSVELQLEQFKESLNVEGMMATRLSIMLDKDIK